MTDPSTRLPAATRMGPVHLSVANLERSLAYWETAIGLRRHRHEGSRANLGVGAEDLVVLHEVVGAKPVQGRTGLYHVALLVPTRLDLARWLLHVAETRVPVTGTADHLVSEAIYLNDPDGHGIEIYADRPRAQWTWKGQTLQMDSLPLEVEGLVKMVEPGMEPFAAMSPATTVGHVHLHVRDIEEAEAFYRDLIGFDVTTRLGNSATFFSAGGYHHHLAANTWAGRGAPAPPPESASLRHLTLVLPTDADRDGVVRRLSRAGYHQLDERDGSPIVSDPSENRVLLTVG